MDFQQAEHDIQHLLVEKKKRNCLQRVVDYLYVTFDVYSWVGIYLLQGEVLVLHSWRGQQATEHTEIPLGEGVCGAAAASGKTEIVDDVKADDRYLACFLSTQSEIVVPIWKHGKVVGEIDIDADQRNAFTSQDAVFLEKVADMLSTHI